MAAIPTLAADHHPPTSPLAWLTSARGQLISCLFAGLLLLLGYTLSWTGLTTTPSVALTKHILVWASFAIGLFHGLRSAREALKTSYVDIDILMVVGAILAALIGQPAEGSLLLILFGIAGALEEIALAKAGRSVQALHSMLPKAASRWTGSAFEPCPVEALSTDDRIRILTGQQVPTDAIILSGQSEMDQRFITGESMPREVSPGDELFAGTLNLGSTLEARVLRPAQESSLQRIVNLVTQAQSQREPVQRFIDRFSQPYAISVFIISILTFLIWWQLLNRAPADAAFTAITLLIVMSPCALVLATPVATLAAISRASRGGVLFKGGIAIERLSRTAAMAFDKTGTLTLGRPTLIDLAPAGWSNKTKLLSLAAALESSSHHPIATAITSGAQARSIPPATLDSPVTFTTSKGLTATLQSREARLGSIDFVQPLITTCLQRHTAALVASAQSQGNIAVAITHHDDAGVLIIADQLRPGAKEMLQSLRALGISKTIMLTGDNHRTAQAVARELAIDQLHAQLLPEDKVRHVQTLAASLKPGQSVCVMGDGVNDAPVLAAAGASIAIGSIGSDAAVESADAVLISDDLRCVPWAIALARQTRSTINLNLIFALTAIIIMMLSVILASLAGIRIPMWLGVIGHEGGTLIVIAHSLLLLTFRSWSKQEKSSPT
jgi:Zn2+/Cd2+-exporting ATPase